MYDVSVHPEPLSGDGVLYLVSGVGQARDETIKRHQKKQKELTNSYIEVTLACVLYSLYNIFCF